MGRTDLPAEQRRALTSAIRWEWFTIGYTVVTIAIIAFVVGGSQAMKTAWIEDMLSLIPQIAFLLSLLVIRHPPSRRFPYGLHRVMGVGHLVAGVALLAIGGSLAVESVIGLVTAAHPAIGTVSLFGHTIWLGWLMVAVMVLVVPGPFFYGHAKAKLAPTLHNKVLYADADMAKADWTTTVASIVGVLGIGIGWWWLDGAAALFISLGIVWDGVKNSRSAVLDLIDQRARTHDDTKPHPLARSHRARPRDAAVGAGGICADARYGPGVPHRGVRGPRTEPGASRPDRSGPPAHRRPRLEGARRRGDPGIHTPAGDAARRKTFVAGLCPHRHGTGSGSLAACGRGAGWACAEVTGGPAEDACGLVDIRVRKCREERAMERLDGPWEHRCENTSICVSDCDDDAAFILR
ncbi:cation transporter [uncultured Microbacterium sp.]|uniref:cation transporter n=1 Tax=uncultured Microbacterium sp. TaxID=191216 RepID=UPI0034591AB6